MMQCFSFLAEGRQPMEQNVNIFVPQKCVGVINRICLLSCTIFLWKNDFKLFARGFLLAIARTAPTYNKVIITIIIIIMKMIMII